MTAEKMSTKQKICAAAKNLFSTHGYGKATIEDIITAAGVTKGAFYHYYKSKQSICIEIIDLVQGEYQHVFDSLPKESNPLEKLKTLIGQILELNSSGQWINCKLMLRLSCEAQVLQTPVKQRLDAFWKWHIEEYNNLITRCREANLISDSLPIQQQVNCVVNMLTGAVWIKTVFNNSTEKKTINYIIEKL